MFSMGLAEKLAEVEPFKTTFLVGVMNRAWPYGPFVAGILGSVDLHRAALLQIHLPAGAALAMPSTFRWFGLQAQARLQQLQGLRRGLRRPGHRRGMARIDHRECLHCLDCMVLYTDTRAARPGQERKRRERDGCRSRPSARRLLHPDHVGATVARPDFGQGRQGRAIHRCHAALHQPAPKPARGPALGARWAGLRTWPWSREGWATPRLVQVSPRSPWPPAWPGSGRRWARCRRAPSSAGGWLGVFEVLVRLSGKRHVKDGPWWRDQYRAANVMDMMSYVASRTC